MSTSPKVHNLDSADSGAQLSQGNYKVFNRIVDWITSDRMQLLNITDRMNDLVRKSAIDRALHGRSRARAVGEVVEHQGHRPRVSARICGILRLGAGGHEHPDVDRQGRCSHERHEARAHEDQRDSALVAMQAAKVRSHE